mmetsp:Transcript_14321/g.34650  ORF Transcript_14321/g.34650 Transcript_14321/m.34650 type:complete len:273 (-) Transcript_14321:1313-2131(-)
MEVIGTLRCTPTAQYFMQMLSAERKRPSEHLQSSNSVLAWLVVFDPPGHSLHVVAPKPELKAPYAHALHSVDFGADAKRPWPHWVHETERDEPANWPTGQSLHTLADPLENVPAPQALHPSTPFITTAFCPGFAMNVPLMQSTQVVDLKDSAECFPAAQSKHTVAPLAAANCPHPHWEHDTAPASAREKPGSQSEHVEAPDVDANDPLAQLTHAGSPESANLPGRHAAHSLPSTPDFVENPFTQFVHVDAPPTENFPRAHGMQGESAAWELR